MDISRLPIFDIYEYYGWESKKSDIFALGCIYFELLTNERLFDGECNKLIFNKIDNNTKNFILNLINPNLKNRFSAKQALNNNYFYDFHNKKNYTKNIQKKIYLYLFIYINK